jgi:capsid protein
MFIINFCLNMFRASLDVYYEVLSQHVSGIIRCLLLTSVSKCFGHHSMFIINFCLNMFRASLDGYY